MTGYNVGGLEIHPTIFQLNTPKPQGRSGLSLGGQDPFHRAPTCRHGMSNPRTVQERILCPATPPPGLTMELGRQMHEKVRDVSDSVRKQWKAVTIFIVELKWMRKDQKKEMCTLGATSSQACWLCISPSSNPTPRINGPQAGRPGPVSPTTAGPRCGLPDALHPAGPPALRGGSPVEGPSPTLRHFHFHSSPGSVFTRFRGNWKHRLSPPKNAGVLFWAT